MTSIPQPLMPFALDGTGHPQVCEQGSTQDVASQALVLMSCPIGANPYDPDFGVPAQLFQTVPINLSGIIAALAQYVPALTDVGSSQSINALGVITELVAGLDPSDTLYPDDTLYPGSLAETVGSASVDINLTGYVQGAD
jgi:hypothetical protein